MSQPYFTSNSEPTGTARSPGYPPIPPPRDHEFTSPFGQEPGGFPGHGDAQSPPGFAPPSPPTASGFGQPRGASAPRRLIAVAGVLGVLTLGLGGFAVVTHGNLADAETEAADLGDSLDKANAALSDQKSKLESAQKELEASNQAAAEASALLETVGQCAAGLYEAWIAYFSEDYETAGTKLDSAMPVCEPLFSEAGA